MAKKIFPSILLAGLLLVIGCSLLQFAFAFPGGASITYNSTAGVPSPVAGNRSDLKGTITTVVLSATQQNQNWKGYVGNITGVLSLADAVGNNIYSWPLSLNKQGRVFLSRSASPVFTGIGCVNTANVTSEEVYYNMTLGTSDNINATFNATSHAGFFIGSTQINANSCRSVATYVNSTSQALTGNQYWQELLLQDTSNNVIYTTIINSTGPGFDGRYYDFQMIVPESAIRAQSTTYYFFTDLG